MNVEEFCRIFEPRKFTITKRTTAVTAVFNGFGLSASIDDDCDVLSVRSLAMTEEMCSSSGTNSKRMLLDAWIIRHTSNKKNICPGDIPVISPSKFWLLPMLADTIVETDDVDVAEFYLYRVLSESAVNIVSRSLADRFPSQVNTSDDIVKAIRDDPVSFATIDVNEDRIRINTSLVNAIQDYARALM